MNVAHRLLVAVIFLLCIKTSSSRSEYIFKDGKIIRCIAEERKALLLFKQGVANEHDLLQSWNINEKEEDCCQWEGVGCDNRTGHVTQLHLSSLILPRSTAEAGSAIYVSNSVLGLPYLNYLDLSHNYLAEIPEFIGSLTNLVHLDLSGTSIGGSIPYEIGNLSKLQYLNFNLSRINSTIPKSIGSLNSLTYLDLSSSQFYGVIPHELGNLSKLQYLDLGYNFDLIAGPENFGWLFKLSSLTYLDLSIMVAPPTIWSSLIQRIPSIEVMILNNCNISGPSSSSSNLSSSISELYLQGNYLTPSIFNWLSQLRGSLIRLDLSYNMLDGSISHYLGNMTALTHLKLAENQLNGSIPESFALMTALTYLDLSANQLNGTIPESVVLMTSLTYLELSANQLNGVLPQSVFNLSSLAYQSSLTYLDLSRNDLTGVIPRELGNLSKLQY